MKKEFTATVYIIENEKALLLFHSKLQKWLPTGGHIECNETPPEAAKREALEETGLEIEFLSQENVWVNQWNAKSFERPYLCLLEEIPQYRDVPAHQHMDMIYVAKPKSANSPVENHKMCWFTLEEIEALEEHAIFTETKDVLRHILYTFTPNLL